ncbi:MAG: transposase [Kiritimatiellia bacterium]
MNSIRSKGWYSRGYLPHYDQSDLPQMVTFRLFDSVPAHVVERWTAELGLQVRDSAGDKRRVELHRRIEAYADQGRGSCWLGQPSVARIVEDAMLHFDGNRYRLLAWCIMPNHVHALVEVISGHRLPDILHSWKSFTANRANEALQHTGHFWARDYHDRYIRNDAHFARALSYIEQNPVTAGLASTPEAWTFGSAYTGNTGTAAFQAAKPGGRLEGGGPGYTPRSPELAELLRRRREHVVS